MPRLNSYSLSLEAVCCLFLQALFQMSKKRLGFMIDNNDNPFFMITEDHRFASPSKTLSNCLGQIKACNEPD